MSALVFRPFLFAWHFLTAIPLSRAHHEPTSRELAASMAWYPIIGFMLGGMLVLGDHLLSGLLPRAVVNLLLIVLLVILTRGLHQDGLADTLDGLAGGSNPVQRLAIMRDGRVGAMGATGLVLSLGLRYVGFLALTGPERIPLLLCMPAIGRWSMVIGAKSAPYARSDGGLAGPFLDHLSFREVLPATVLLSIVLPWLIGPLGTVICVVMGAVIAQAIAAFLSRKIGGVTGDTLGATNEIVEIVFLIVGPGLMVFA